MKTLAYTKYKQFLRWTALKVPLLVPRFDPICPTVRRARLHGNIRLARGTSKVDSDLYLELIKWLPCPTYLYLYYYIKLKLHTLKCGFSVNMNCSHNCVTSLCSSSREEGSNVFIFFKRGGEKG